AEPYVTPFTSDHPRHVFSNIIKTSIERATRYSSTFEAFNYERRYIKLMLLYNDYPSTFIENEFHKYFSQYISKSPFLPLIDDEQNYFLMRKEILGLPTPRQSQVAMSAALADIDNDPPDDGRQQPDLYPKKHEEKISNYNEKFFTHFTYEKRFDTCKRDMHQVYNHAFKDTPALYTKQIVGNRNRRQAQSELIRKRPNKTLLQNTTITKHMSGSNEKGNKASWPKKKNNVNDSTNMIFDNYSVGTTSDSKGTSDNYHYAVNLRLSPVERGIICHSGHWHTHQFTGLGAFNFYFDYLLPYADGFSLPDVWDGYFHITLGKFDLIASSDANREKIENSLVQNIQQATESQQHYQNHFPCKFLTKRLEVYDGSRRFAERQGIDFVALAVQDQTNVWNELCPLLVTIKEEVEKIKGKWENVPLTQYRDHMHVTVRKYRHNSDKWSPRQILNSGILQRVLYEPLEFVCVALDIVPTRRQACLRSQWCIGVTGIKLACQKCNRNYSDDKPGYCAHCDLSGNDHRCSGCGREENRQREWPGYCCGCGRYERTRPLWSTLSENQ
ncbi:unnamed protein product, partial [Rotaria magnacalcarata]